MRILHIGKFYPPHRGGMESHLQDLAVRLARSEEVQVLVSSSDHHSYTEFRDNVLVARAMTACILSSAPICPTMPLHMLGKSWDVVHLHLPNPTACAAYLSAKPVGKLVVTYHSDIVRQQGVLRRLADQVQDSILRRADIIIVSSRNYINSSEPLALYRDKCRIVPLGIDIECFGCPSREEIGAIRQQFGSKVVLGVGRLVYYKGFEYLIRAMSHIPEATLLIAGTGPLDSQLRSLVEELSLTNRVVFLGDVNPLKAFYYAADVFVLAATERSEAYGIVQLEAMAAGTPVINTNIDSGVPSLSLDRLTGFTVPPRDEIALARAISKLLQNPGLRESYGKAARKRVEERFTSSQMVQKHLEIYREITQGNENVRAENEGVSLGLPD